MDSCQVRHWLIGLAAVSFTVGGCDKKVAEPKDSAPAAKPSASSASSPAALPDSELDDAVKLGLTRDPGVDAKKISVKASGGKVELGGSVSDLSSARRATLDAERVKGVREVKDGLTLDLVARADSDLQKDVNNGLSLNAATHALGVHVAAKTGTVTLTGKVKSWSDRDVAERVTEGIRGVRAVKNDLALEPVANRSDADLQKSVTNRFHWDRLLDDGLLGVTVKDGKVTLSGVVRSAAERRLAARLAWLGGAKAVDDGAVTVEWGAKEKDVRKNKPANVPDAQIATAIRDAAQADSWLAGAKLDVSVAAGKATLRGTVDSLEGKSSAETLARATLGVNDVDDQLTVVPPAAVANHVLEDHVQSVLRSSPALTALAIGVAAKGGTVSLTGTVRTSFDRAEATELAAGVLGVERVDDQLKLDRPDVAYVYDGYLAPYEPYIANLHYAPAKPADSDANIDKQIKGELMSSPFVDANAVQVVVAGGKATLNGSVGSLRDKREATEDAFEGGAIAVENRLVVKMNGG
ncbi:MAG TPA: BON domain-containing protein [Polyangiaceae bacterium]|nr:BON domain-containing protein [Polyangiaceae bacterium]